MTRELYTGGDYLARNPTWHVEHSPWKAGWILKMLTRNALIPRTICEVGCGAGEILSVLHERLDEDVQLTGYEISPQAFELCEPRGRERLAFKCEDFTTSGNARFDLLLAIDLIEHLEDYFSFLRAISDRSELKIFHIPLDLSVQGMLRDRMSLLRETVGHLHFFTRQTALAALIDSGYEVIDWFYTSGSTELPNKGGKAALLKYPRKLAYRLSPERTAQVLGGYSVMVLAR